MRVGASYPEDVMRKHADIDQIISSYGATSDRSTRPESTGLLPTTRLLTAAEVAQFVGCHEETVRRAYWRGLLKSQQFGVRSKRFHPADVLDWIARGAPTKVL
jgi:excisionase family DNA binding protein